MIASVLTTAHWHEPDSQAVACIRTIGLPGPGNLPGAAQNSQRLARGRGPAGLLLHPASVIQRASLIAPIPAGRPAYGRLVETSALVQKDDAMADDSTTIELTRSELRQVASYAVVCARSALAIFERERPDDRRP